MTATVLKSHVATLLELNYFRKYYEENNRIMPFKQLKLFISALPNMFKYYSAYAQIQATNKDELEAFNKTHVIPYCKAQLLNMVDSFVAIEEVWEEYETDSRGCSYPLKVNHNCTEENKETLKWCNQHKAHFEELYEAVYAVVNYQDIEKSLIKSLHWAISLEDYYEEYYVDKLKYSIIDNSLSGAGLRDIHTIAIILENRKFALTMMEVHDIGLAFEESKKVYREVLDKLYDHAIKLQRECWSNKQSEWDYYREVQYFYNPWEDYYMFEKLKDISPEQLASIKPGKSFNSQAGHAILVATRAYRK